MKPRPRSNSARVLVFNEPKPGIRLEQRQNSCAESWISRKHQSGLLYYLLTLFFPMSNRLLVLHCHLLTLYFNNSFVFICVDMIIMYQLVNCLYKQNIK